MTEAITPYLIRFHRFWEELGRFMRNLCETNRPFGYRESMAPLRGLTLVARPSITLSNSICGRQQLPPVSASTCPKMEQLWNYLLRSGIFGSDLQRMIMMGPTRCVIEQ